MPFPNFPNKWKDPSFTTAAKHLAYLKSIGMVPEKKPPHTFIFGFVGQFLAETQKLYKLDKTDGTFRYLYYFNDHPGFAIGDLGVGAPINAQKMELLSAWGVERFLVLGIAGGLQKHLEIGEIVLVDKALRDEGTSYHYVAPEKYAYPDPNLTKKLLHIFQENHVYCRVGSAWSTDAIYRETRKEQKEYQHEGIVAVDMETSALFSVAKYLKKEIAGLLVISDDHTKDEWDINFYQEKTLQGLHQALKMLLKL